MPPRLETDTSSASVRPAAARVDVVHVADLDVPWQSQLERAGLLGRCDIEGWEIPGSSQSLRYATHGVFRYFGKFPPPIAGHLIARHTEPGDLVADPMCGSGTTGVEAVLAGRRYALADVSPLSVLVARTKCTHRREQPILDALRRVEPAYEPRDEGSEELEPVGLRNDAHWFLPETMRSLRGLKAAIRRAACDDARDALWTAFAATVRRVSRATTQQGRLFLDTATALADALPEFTKRTKQVARAVATLPMDSGSRGTVARRSLLDEEAASVEPCRLLVLHPPYFNAYRYSRINSLELAWLGHAHAAVRKEEVREFFKGTDAARVGDYVSDMHTAMEHAERRVAPGGTLALMIGDTVLKGEYVPVVRRLLDAIADLPLRLVKLAVRIPRQTEASWVASQRRTGSGVGIRIADYVLTFERA